MTKKITNSSLKKLNIIAGFLHLIRGVVVLLLSRDLAIAISGNFLAFNESTETLEPATTSLFSVQLPWFIAGFSFYRRSSTF